MIKRLFFSVFILLNAVVSFSQIKVSGNVIKEGKNIPGSWVALYKNSEFEREVNTGKTGKFEFELELNQIYMIEARKAGHFPVMVNFSTELPASETENGAKGKFSINLDLPEKFNNLSPSILKKPIAQIKYNPALGKFDYDLVYFEMVKEGLARFYSQIDGYREQGIMPVLEPELKPTVIEPSKIDLRGKIFKDDTIKAPLTNVVVVLKGEGGEMYMEATTDTTGLFVFQNLPSGKGFVVSIDQRKLSPGIKTLFLADEKGKILKKFGLENGWFALTVLPHDHHQGLAYMHAEDPWLKLKDIKSAKKDTVIILENIYYETGKSDITPAAAKVLDKVVLILNENPGISMEVNAHTDSRATAQFNLELSKKRAASAVGYITLKGGDPRRISGNGYGETQLLNYCADGVECKEEQHAKNRRTEFVVSRIRP